MRVIIAGPRDYLNYDKVLKAIVGSGLVITEVVSGGATGVDRLGERWAKSRDIPIALFPADWSTHGKAAGPIRNKQMAEYADALIAIRRGFTPGTANMIETARWYGLLVHIHEVTDV